MAEISFIVPPLWLLFPLVFLTGLVGGWILGNRSAWLTIYRWWFEEDI